MQEKHSIQKHLPLTEYLTPDQIAEFQMTVVDRARNYARDMNINWGDPSARESSINIVLAAFAMGSNDKPIVKRVKQETLSAVKKGMAMRERLVADAIDWYNFATDNGGSPLVRRKNIEDFGINQDQLTDFEDTLRDNRSHADLKPLVEFVDLVEQRSEVLNVVSRLVVADALSLNSDDQQLDFYANMMSTKSTQSKALRGFVVSKMLGFGTEGEEQVNPLYINSRQLLLLEEASWSLLPTQDERVEFISKQVESLGVATHLRAQTEELLLIYLNDLMERAHSLSDKYIFNRGNTQDPEFWELLNLTFDNLPMEELTKSVVFCVSAQALPDAIKNQTPHLWVNGVSINGMIIPSPQDIYLAQRVYWGSRTYENKSLRERITLARTAWKKYTRKLDTLPSKIEELQQELGEFSIDEEPVITIAEPKKPPGVSAMMSKYLGIQGAIDKERRRQEKLKSISGIIGNASKENIASYIQIRDEELLGLIKTAQESMAMAQKRIYLAITDFGYGGNWRVEDVYSDNYVRERTRYREYLEKIQNNDLFFAETLFHKFWESGELARNNFIDELEASSPEKDKLRAGLIRLLRTRIERNDQTQAMEHFKRLVILDVKSRSSRLDLIETYVRRQNSYLQELDHLADEETLRLDISIVAAQARNTAIEALPSDLYKNKQTIEKQLPQAKKFLAAWKRASGGGFTFTIPKQDDLISVLYAQRHHAEKYKDSNKRESLLEFLDLVEQYRYVDLIPLKESAGKLVSVLIRGLERRIHTAEALLAQEALEIRYREYQEYLEQYSKYKEQESVMSKKSQKAQLLAKLKRSLENADESLLNSMTRLGFAISEDLL